MLYEALPYDIPEGEPTPEIVATPDATRAPDTSPDTSRIIDPEIEEPECQTIGK
jgi:hypothetical protein